MGVAPPVAADEAHDRAPGPLPGVVEEVADDQSGVLEVPVERFEVPPSVLASPARPAHRADRYAGRGGHSLTTPSNMCEDIVTYEDIVSQGFLRNSSQ